MSDGGEHEGNDDAARGAKQDGQYNEPCCRGDPEPAEHEYSRGVTGHSDDIELAETPGNGTSKYPA